MSERVPITYTFGNHMHWVDMQWLWGYHVLPGSVRDMLHFCRETGAKGNVNFDGIGYEKLACEDPDAFAELRAAVQEGTIEVVGASYGQPYGLFHGGESNVRQRIYGARTVRRLFGKWPKTFWEEEFDFFPQLPQILRGCGFEFASLYFQWTWHTPEVPKEDVPVVWWEGVDGSRLKTATRNRLNLHQWPEDVQILMDELAETGGEADSLILQWLELMPSPDWMCRSEVLLPKTKELLGDERFQVSFATLGEYLDAYKPDPPTRRYTMDDVWHGMTLGKNGDHHPRLSARVESTILESETIHAILGRFGRPYARWDVYPIWELEEAWRNLLAAQHHDNHECEKLCGHVAMTQFKAAIDLAGLSSARQHLADRIPSDQDRRLLVNHFGWPSQMVTGEFDDWTGSVVVPPFGYVQVTQEECTSSEMDIVETDHGFKLSRMGTVFEIDIAAWRVTMNTTCGETIMDLPFLQWMSDGKTHQASHPVATVNHGYLQVSFGSHERVSMGLNLAKGFEALVVAVEFSETARPLDSGLFAALKTIWPCNPTSIRSDQPYAVAEVNPHGSWQRKYPEGDWMTSPQWFESVSEPFTGLTFIDLIQDDGSGVLIGHHHCQQWLRLPEGVAHVELTIDSWDQGKGSKQGTSQYLVFPHGNLSDAQRVKLAQDIDRFWMSHLCAKGASTGDLPSTFSFASNTPENVVMTALYRETRDRGYGTDNYAANDFEADYPYIIRLVEFDGLESQVELKINGTVAAAAKTNLLGQHELTLTPELGSGEYGPQSTLRFKMRPKEIATVYFDLIEGRKQTRDLDAKREIWATVHRTETTG